MAVWNTSLIFYYYSNELKLTKAHCNLILIITASYFTETIFISLLMIRSLGLLLCPYPVDGPFSTV